MYASLSLKRVKISFLCLICSIINGESVPKRSKKQTNVCVTCHQTVPGRLQMARGVSVNRSVGARLWILKRLKRILFSTEREKNEMIRCEKHQNLLLCSINTFLPSSPIRPPRWAVGICRRDMFIYLRALFKNKIKAFHRAFAQLLLLLEKREKKKEILCRVNLQRFRKRGEQRSLMPSIN